MFPGVVYRVTAMVERATPARFGGDGVTVVIDLGDLLVGHLTGADLYAHLRQKLITVVHIRRFYTCSPVVLRTLLSLSFTLRSCAFKRDRGATHGKLFWGR